MGHGNIATGVLLCRGEPGLAATIKLLDRGDCDLANPADRLLFRWDGADVMDPLLRDVDRVGMAMGVDAADPAAAAGEGVGMMDAPGSLKVSLSAKPGDGGMSFRSHRLDKLGDFLPNPRLSRLFDLPSFPGLLLPTFSLSFLLPFPNNVLSAFPLDLRSSEGVLMLPKLPLRASKLVSATCFGMALGDGAGL